MKNKTVFAVPKRHYPQIYIYSDKHNPDWLKVGYTNRKNPEDRIKEQYNTRLKLEPDAYNYLHSEAAVNDSGEFFTDKTIHKQLKKKGIQSEGEFFKTDLKTVKSTILEVKSGVFLLENRTETFKMRKEQEEAVALAEKYYKKSFKEGLMGKPKFLWNCKMRFGKTFSAYQLAKRMNYKKILVITYKPAVENAWRDDLMSHVDFLGWQFVGRNAMSYTEINNSLPYVCFASFQDLLGTTEDGDIKKHNEWIHRENWDMIVFDEYHFGAWRESAKELTDSGDLDFELLNKEPNLPINGKSLLYLSGTPFRAIETGEFTEEQIYNWTYADEQKAKNEYVGLDNPYASLPEMMILTYKLPEHIAAVAQRGEFNEFNLSYFFKATGEYENAEFINKDSVQNWLDLIRGAMELSTVDDLKSKEDKPPFPFTDVNFKKILSHMLWFLPDVASCYALSNLLKEPQNIFYHNYDVVVAAGERAGSGVKALEPVMKSMGDPLKTRTITLTCGKLTTGVTVKPWTGIFMLRTLNSPETYFQSAFRVQSPWTIPLDGGKVGINKPQCFVFDFDPNRALKQIAQYADKLNTKDINPQAKIEEFIRYLPILAYDGLAMEEVDAAGLLDISMGQTTATLLAKGWNNTLLINLDSEILKKLANSDIAMKAINSIESFRANSDGNVSSIIINQSDEIKALKTKQSQGKLTPSEKRQLTEAEIKYKDNREIIKEKLKTLATRIPLFMYLTDYREEKLTDVITKLEPALFKKVTGLTIDDFNLLLSLGLFNSNLMNQAVYRFRSYEDASISYSGINRHQVSNVGYFDMTVTRDEHESGILS